MTSRRIGKSQESAGTRFARISTAMEKRLADWGSDEDEPDSELRDTEQVPLLDGLLKVGAKP